jgi:hypothetical protein
MVTGVMIEQLNARALEVLTDYTSHLIERLVAEGISVERAAVLVGNPPPFTVAVEDFEKKKRTRTAIPYYERCSGLKADCEQCTRRRQGGSLFCGTHMKGTPYGQVSDGKTASDKITVRAQEVMGIVYWVDDEGNVYNQEDIHSRKKNPRIVARAGTGIHGIQGINGIHGIHGTHALTDQAHTIE